MKLRHERCGEGQEENGKRWQKKAGAGGKKARLGRLGAEWTQEEFQRYGPRRCMPSLI